MNDPGIALPSHLADAVCCRWPETGPAWCAAIGDEAAALYERYGVTNAAVLPSEHSYVVGADTVLGPLVLRATADPEGAHQAGVVKALSDLGVGPTVHEIHATGTGTWTVRDRVDPGAVLETGAGRRYCDVDKLLDALVLMRDQPPPDPGMPSIVEWLRRRLSNDAPEDLPDGATPSSREDRRAALAILDKLESGADKLCHGNTVPSNLLTGGDGRTMMISPRGVVGEIEYDAAVMFLYVCRLPVRVQFIERAIYRDLSPGRILQWHAVVEAARL